MIESSMKDRVEHIHFIGVGGSGMCGIAEVLHNLGYTVSGSDQVNSSSTQHLQALGVRVYPNHRKENVENAEVVVVSSAIHSDNPELLAAMESSIPVIPRALMLAELMRFKRGIAVAGTHGKTTTASMLAFILQEAGKRPSWLIGGVPENLAVSSHYEENSPYFVIEADEYDTAFFDKRSKFVHYHPDTLIINNLEYDHADIFANLSAVQWQFHQLLRIVRQKGQIIYRANDPAIEQLLDMGVWTPTLPFASTEGFHIKSQNQGNQGFSIFEANKEITFVQWSLFRSPM